MRAALVVVLSLLLSGGAGATCSCPETFVVPGGNDCGFVEVRGGSCTCVTFEDTAGAPCTARGPEACEEDEAGFVMTRRLPTFTNTTDMPSARLVSNLVAAHPPQPVLSAKGASAWLWQWGQFIDHDVVLTLASNPPDRMNIPVPRCDPHFDIACSGDQELTFTRSMRNADGQVVNELDLLDGSAVYGTTQERQRLLRRHDGTGKLHTSNEGGSVDGGLPLLPFNVFGLENDMGDGTNQSTFFAAGDVRANEQIGLTAVHTLFVREHNRLCDVLAAEDSTRTEEELYSLARKLVNAEIQSVTYNEYLRLLLGGNALPTYSDFKPDTDVSIAFSFGSAAFRYGHSTVGDVVPNAGGASVPLDQAFFRPQWVLDNGVDGVLAALGTVAAEAVDPYIIDALRNMLFGPPGAGGMDLFSLNLQRGRDHGVASYTMAREAIGLSRVTSFADITNNTRWQQAYASAYGTVENIDLLAGGFAEEHVTGSLLGPTLRSIISDQFIRLRDGDPGFFLRPSVAQELSGLASGFGARLVNRQVMLGDIISLNIRNHNLSSRNVFQL